MSTTWVVVGGGDKGGILVREGQATSSAQCSERLSTGSLVEELELQGERLHYKLLTGDGPGEGWISIKLKDKDLAVRRKKQSTAEPSPLEAEKPAASAPSPIATVEESSLQFYCQACEVSGGVKGFTDEGEALFTQAAAVEPSVASAGAAAHRAVKLMSLSSMYSQEVSRFVPATGDAFDALLAFYRSCFMGTDSAPAELTALRQRKCTGQIRPGSAILGMQLYCPECEIGPLCVECYLAHAGHDGAGTALPTCAPSRCSCAKPGAAAAAPGGRDDELETWIRAAAEGSGADSVPATPAGWPIAWRILAHHVRELRELEATGKGSLLGSVECAQLRELHALHPPIKLHTLSPLPAKTGPSRLVVVLHGGMQTQRHLKFMHQGILGGKPPASNLPMAVLGVEADFAFENLGAGLTKPQAGFNYLRFGTLFGRLGELILSAARVYWQCIDAHLAAHPECKVVDLVGFSAGGLLSWIIFMMAPQSPQAWRFSTLSMMSPRLEDILYIQDSFIKAHLKAHGARVYLGWGEYEDLKENGAPFSAMAASLKKWLPLNRLQTKMYPKVWHTMPPAQLEDVKTFLEESWKSGPPPGFSV